jgi:hypothetical protein
VGAASAEGPGPIHPGRRAGRRGQRCSTRPPRLGRGRHRGDRRAAARRDRPPGARATPSPTPATRRHTEAGVILDGIIRDALPTFGPEVAGRSSGGSSPFLASDNHQIRPRSSLASAGCTPPVAACLSRMYAPVAACLSRMYAPGRRLPQQDAYNRGSGTRNEDATAGRPPPGRSPPDRMATLSRGTAPPPRWWRAGCAGREEAAAAGRQAYAHRPIRPPLTTARRSPATGAWDSNTPSCVFERVTAAWVNVRC